MTRSQIFSSLLIVATALHVSAFTVPTGARVGFPSTKPSLPQTKLALMTRLQMSLVDTDTEKATKENQLQPKSPGTNNSYLKTLEAKTSESADTAVAADEKEEMSETQKLMAKVKESGTAGVVSYALWELAFWFISIPVCILGYQKVTGHWPDLSNSDDQAKLGAEAFAFVNFARFAVPLRIGLALSTTPWIQDNIVDRFMKKNEGGESMEEPVMDQDSTLEQK